MPRTTRTPTYPLAHAARHKPRRLPLVLRVAKGAIHSIIIVPVLLHSLFTVLIVCLDRYVSGELTIPPTIIPSLSIVVGLMLVFRNSTSYDRFWTGRNCLTTISTSIRNLTRSFLVSSKGKDGKKLSDMEQADTERIIRVLVAILYAVKNNLRAEFNIPPASILSNPPPPPRGTRSHPVSRRPSMESGLTTPKAEYTTLLPDGMMGYEDQGLGLPIQLSVLVEAYIRRGFERSWFHAPQAASLSLQVNNLVDAYGRMETIRSTPIPVAHLIHGKQVLALFGCVLPFAIVDSYGWWSIPIVAIVAFTLYGIEGIGVQLEDPFGYDKNDIKMEGIIEDTRMEVMCLLDEWKARTEGREDFAWSGMFD